MVCSNVTLAGASVCISTRKPFDALVEGLRVSDSGEGEIRTPATLAGRPVRCPYCGRPGAPATLDHFLPRSKFGEFSLYAKNLIPSCWDCNHAKLADVWHESGRRLFLNPYFDEFLDEPFVHLRVVPDAVDGFEVPLFNFEFGIDTMSGDSAATCASHFRLMHVTSLLRDQFALQLRSLRRQYGHQRSRGHETLDQLRARLSEELAGRERADAELLGANCWEAIFARGVLANAPLMEFIVS